MARTVFATVGTTQFDALTQALVSTEVTALLARQGYRRLVIQIGRGSEPTLPASPPPALSVEWYRFKDSLAADMRSAALLVSHAGAGSIMEGLACDACLLVVVNDALMDNHQQASACVATSTATRATAHPCSPAALPCSLSDYALRPQSRRFPVRSLRRSWKSAHISLQPRRATCSAL